MWVTGLRLKFFFTIFIVLSITAASISSIHYHFFKQERLRLIELNLEQNVTLIENSDINLTRKEFSTMGQELIDEVIGDDKINMIVAIYGKSGRVLYMNDNAYIFDLPDFFSGKIKEWEDIEHKDYFIKYLTKKEKGTERIIKVGMILNQSLLRWKDLNQRIFIFVAIILTMITFISFFLTYILFKPVQFLAEQVNLMSEKIEKSEFSELQSWFHMMRKKKKGNDEFHSLIDSLDKLAHKITETQTLTQKWSALMAHELKAPMTLLRISIDRLISDNKLPESSVCNVERELKKLDEIIMDFLEWASVENDSSKPELHILSPSKRAQEIFLRMERGFPNITMHFESSLGEEFKTFCNPIHFDQVIDNLLLNGIKYGNGSVMIKSHLNTLSIIDNGSGFPDGVLENFGKPFNKYTRPGVTGHGLGLAWVNTIAKKYDWKIQITNNNGTNIKITFPLN